MDLGIFENPPSLAMSVVAALGVTRLAIWSLRNPKNMGRSELRRRLRRLM